MGLRLVLQPRPLCPAFVCDFCSSARNFACGFLQIPPHDGHPCRSANTSYYQACSGLSPPSYCPWRAYNTSRASSKRRCPAFLLFKTGSAPFSPHPPMVPAVLADRDAPCHHLVAPGRRALSLPLRLLRPNHRQKQQLERPYPPANQQPPRQAVARQPAFANQLHPHVTAAAARTFHAKHTLSSVDFRSVCSAVTPPASRTAPAAPLRTRCPPPSAPPSLTAPDAPPAQSAPRPPAC